MTAPNATERSCCTAHVLADQGAMHESPIDAGEIMATIRATLDSLPLATTVDDLLVSLRAHIELLLREIEAKDWARYGQDGVIGVVVMATRGKLDQRPQGGPEVARCFYAQGLARICRQLLHLAAVNPTDEQRLRETAP